MSSVVEQQLVQKPGAGIALLVKVTGGIKSWKRVAMVESHWPRMSAAVALLEQLAPTGASVAVPAASASPP